MITFNNDTPITEGILDDSLKSAANMAGINPAEIKSAWKEIDSSAKLSDYSKAVQKATKATDIGVGAVDDKLNKMFYGDKAKSNTVNTSSIVARARNSVLQFPVYITQSLPVSAAQTMAKLFERVYATLVQTTLSQNTIISMRDANDLVFLKNFHTNLKESTDFVLLNEYYEPIDDLDAMLKEAADYTEEILPGVTMKVRAIPAIDKDLIAENARLLNDPLTGLSYLSEAKKSASGDPVATEAELTNIAVTRMNLTGRDKDIYNANTPEKIKEVAKTYNISVSEASDERKELRKRAYEEVKKLKVDIKKGVFKGVYYDADADVYRKKPVRTSDPIKAIDAPHILRDADIKKMNGMLPYTIEASFIIEETNRAVHYIIGIKSVMHLISTKDLGEDLSDLVTGNLQSLRKVKYKSGEIKFMDYVFNVKQIKKDAAKHINYNKRWINTLKRLAEFDKLNGSLLKSPTELISLGTIPIPNGTLILSQADVTTMTTNTGIDISDISNARRLAKSLFLIAVCIVDATAGSFRVFFPDNDSDWDVQSLASVDAEISKTDNSALMNELNKKINR